MSNEKEEHVNDDKTLTLAAPTNSCNNYEMMMKCQIHMHSYDNVIVPTMTIANNNKTIVSKLRW